MAREKQLTFDPEWIRELSVLVYRQRLMDDNGADAPDRMIAKDKDNGEKLRGRAAQYDPLTRAYLKVLGFKPRVES